MEHLIQSIPVAISMVLSLVLVLMVITNIIVEVLKKLTWGKLPVNILAFVVSLIVTLLAFLAVCQIVGLSITWYMVVGAIILGIFVAYAAMFGFDKFKQTIEQINSIKIKKPATGGDIFSPNINATDHGEEQLE